MKELIKDKLRIDVCEIDKCLSKLNTKDFEILQFVNEYCPSSLDLINNIECNKRSKFNCFECWANSIK